MARRPTDAGAGVVATDGSAAGDAATVRLASLRLPVPSHAFAREETRDHGDGASRAPCLVPRLLRLLVPKVHAEAVKVRPLMTIPSTSHLDEADGSEALQGPTAALQVTSRQA